MGDPKILTVRTISSISVSNYICIVIMFWFINARFFYVANKRSLQKNKREGLK